MTLFHFFQLYTFRQEAKGERLEATYCRLRISSDKRWYSVRCSSLSSSKW